MPDLFSDPDQFVEAMNGGFGLRTTVVGKGPFRARIASEKIGRLICQLGTMTTAINHATSRPERISLVFLNKGAPPMVRDGIAVTADEISVWPSLVDCCSLVDGSHSWGIVSLSTADFERATGSRFPLRGRIERVRPSHVALAGLRASHRAAMGWAGRWHSPQLIRQLTNDVMHDLVRCLAVPDGTVRIDPSAGARVIRHFEHYLEANHDWPVSMIDLCAAVGVAGRTLRHYCEDCLSMSPRDYMLLFRLNRVRSELALADPAATTVAEIALRYGFTQLGRFSVRYRAVFDEAPSTTLRTSSRPIMHTLWP